MVSKPNAERIRYLLNYDPDTGIFRWRVYRTGNAKAGDVAGHVHHTNRLDIRVDGTLYGAGRIAWLWMTGEWPAHEIDHINRNAMDNRFCNLRQATTAQNCRNRLWRRESALPKGVYIYGNGKIVAKIMADGVSHYLGVFKDVESAARAYAEKAPLLHGEFARLS